MNVLMLGWEFPPHITGGLGTACQGLVRGLTEAGGVDIAFVMPQLRGGERQRGVSFLCARSLAGDAPGRAAGSDPERRRLDDFFAGFVPPDVAAAFHEDDEDALWMAAPGVDGRLSGAYQGMSIADALAYADSAPHLLAAAQPFDVVHAHDWLTFLLAARVKQASNRPLVVHVHSVEPDRAGNSRNGNIGAIERFGMYMADRIIAVSEYTRQVLVREYRIAPGKIEVVHNGVGKIENAALPAQRDIFRVSFIGRITHQKGPAYFLHAAKKILDRQDDVRFVMAGTGDLLPVAKALANKLGISRQIDFPGFLDPPGVKALLAASSVYVMPSVSEPFGIGALEAAQSGVPVVLSRNSGVAEVMRDAICVDPADTDAIADAVLRTRNNPALAEMTARAAKDAVAELEWKVAARKIKTIYRNFLN
jgi:glycosyltransferase involved in cell wall biosynthesis